MSTIEISNTTCTYKSLASNLKDNVKVFRLSNVKIEGTEDDMHQLMRNMRGHPCMETFFVKNVTTADPNATLDMIVSSLLASAPRIDTIHIENTSIDASTLATVSYCDSLQSLELPRNGFQDKDAAVIADALTSSSVQSLDLSGNELSNVGGQYLERFLEKNTTIRTISLNGNKNMSGDECAKISAKLMGRTAMAA
ncbi:hypothetical protein ACA910_007599 [Epithemia clementina (nom. ined.)]